MCALHDGQIVELAAPLTSCRRWHSKHSTTVLRRCFHIPSSRCINDDAAGAATGVSMRARGTTAGARFGSEGEKCAPHWRHIVVLAAAYSDCLKPQCGHSTLTLTGAFATASREMRLRLSSTTERCRLDRLVVANDLRAMRGLVRIRIAAQRHAPARHFRFADERGSFLNDETRRL